MVQQYKVIGMESGKILFSGRQSETFHGMDNKTFSITNENADKDLYLWVLDWLLGNEETQ